MKIIEVIVSPQGETKIETRGYAGASCKQASEFLERALGIKQSEKLTAEFYQPLTQEQQQENKA